MNLVHMYDGAGKTACEPLTTWGKWVSKDEKLVTCYTCKLVIRKRMMEDVIISRDLQARNDTPVLAE
jgi:hypothetical protein